MINAYQDFVMKSAGGVKTAPRVLSSMLVACCL
jgi:hypothetical protein